MVAAEVVRAAGGCFAARVAGVDQRWSSPASLAGVESSVGAKVLHAIRSWLKRIGTESQRVEVEIVPAAALRESRRRDVRDATCSHPNRSDAAVAGSAVRSERRSSAVCRSRLLRVLGALPSEKTTR